jgi:hypothetical protein
MSVLRPSRQPHRCRPRHVAAVRELRPRRRRERA